MPWMRQFPSKNASPTVHFRPFDGWDIPAGKSAIVEVYPALWNRSAHEGRTSDQHDAYSVAAWLKQADQDGRLAGFLNPALPVEEWQTAQIEGRIPGGNSKRYTLARWHTGLILLYSKRWVVSNNRALRR